MYRLFLLLLILHPFGLHAQNNYNNHWFFGRGHNVNFTNGSIQNGGIPSSNNTNTYYTNSSQLYAQVAYSHPNTGTLEYFIQIPYIVPNASQRNTLRPIFFSPNGQPMPNGWVDITSYHLENGYPLIVPHVQDSNLSYVFICLEGGLYVSTIDMRLNNGNGDIMASEKMREVLPKRKLFGSKFTIAPSCDGFSLFVKGSEELGFYSIKINDLGINPQTAYATVGLLPLTSYKTSASIIGTMKASPNGQLLAVATGSGVELYDIERCSGKLKNPRLIDTTTSFGVCFSPDSKVLYTTRAEYQTGYFQSSEIVQWDVSQPQDINRIKASEQVVLINSAYNWPDWVGITSSYMVDIAQGKDGKLYILSNTVYADSVQQMPTPMPPTTIVPWAQTVHIIHQPNVLGIGCQAERDAHYLDGFYINRAGFYLPHPIFPVPNEAIDTLYHPLQAKTMCWGQGIALSIDAMATCIQWNTGEHTASIMAKDTGLYWVSYSLNCTVHIDSFYVHNIQLPDLPDYLLACENQAILDINLLTNNTTLYQYELQHLLYNDPRTIRTDSSFTWYSLLPGTYQINLQAGHCDTSFKILVDTLPAAHVTIQPASDTIAYGDYRTLQAEGAILYSWFPTISLDTGTGPTVIARPQKSTIYEVIGINAYGCRDTAYSTIMVDHRMEFFLPNAFSPNGDGLNDVFRLEGLTYQRLTEWGIYNRWGEQVFFSTNIQDGWDGTYRGQPCEAGLYYYYLQFFRTDGKLQEHRGEVHLIR